MCSVAAFFLLEEILDLYDNMLCTACKWYFNIFFLYCMTCKRITKSTYKIVIEYQNNSTHKNKTVVNNNGTTARLNKRTFDGTAFCFCSMLYRMCKVSLAKYVARTTSGLL